MFSAESMVAIPSLEELPAQPSLQGAAAAITARGPALQASGRGTGHQLHLGLAVAGNDQLFSSQGRLHQARELALGSQHVHLHSQKPRCPCLTEPDIAELEAPYGVWRRWAVTPPSPDCLPLQASR